MTATIFNLMKNYSVHVLLIEICCLIMVSQELPSDSTGELTRLCAFIEENMDICKWVALTVMVIQVCTFSLFLKCLYLSIGTVSHLMTVGVRCQLV